MTTVDIDARTSHFILGIAALSLAGFSIRTWFLPSAQSDTNGVNSHRQRSSVRWYVQGIACVLFICVCGVFITSRILSMLVQHFTGTTIQLAAVVTDTRQVKTARSLCKTRIQFQLQHERGRRSVCLETVSSPAIGPTHLSTGQRIVVDLEQNALGTHVVRISEVIEEDN
jgi:hypothetical protein